MKPSSLIFALLLGGLLAGKVPAQTVGGTTNAIPPGPAGYLFQRMFLDGPITNWWSRPEPELRAAADRGDADAGLAIARHLLAGPDRTNHLDEAEQRIAQAAEKGQVQAQYLMGYLALNPTPRFPGVQSLQDVGSALDWFELAAAGGSVRACWEIGELYNYGKVRRNYAEAERWYGKAAERGHVPSIRALMELYRFDHQNADGTLFKADAAKAGKWETILQDSRNGSVDPAPGRRHDIVAEAASSLGPREFQLFKQALSNAAARGNSIPGVTPSTGRRPERSAREILREAQALESAARTPGEFEEALSRFGEVNRFPVTAEARAAAAGILRLYVAAHLDPARTDPRPLLPLDPELLPVPAQRLELADLLMRGNPFVPADPPTAVRGYLALAREGNATAMRRIGRLWDEGVEEKADSQEAAKWFARAKAAEASGR